MIRVTKTYEHKSLFHSRRYGELVCPKCGQSKEFLLFAEGIRENKDSSFTELRLIRCEECNWVGNNFELLEDWEFKSIKRTKLIDKMLNKKGGNKSPLFIKQYLKVFLFSRLE